MQNVKSVHLSFVLITISNAILLLSVKTLLSLLRMKQQKSLKNYRKGVHVMSVNSNPFNRSETVREGRDPNAEYYHPINEGYDNYKLGLLQSAMKLEEDARCIHQVDAGGIVSFTMNDFVNYHKQKDILFRKRVQA